MEFDKKLLWWGYIHENNSIYIKRYFSDRDIEEAEESPFVSVIWGPFEADNRENAIEIFKKRFNIE